MIVYVGTETLQNWENLTMCFRSKKGLIPH